MAQGGGAGRRNYLASTTNHYVTYHLMFYLATLMWSVQNITYILMFDINLVIIACFVYRYCMCRSGDGRQQ